MHPKAAPLAAVAVVCLTQPLDGVGAFSSGGAALCSTRRARADGTRMGMVATPMPPLVERREADQQEAEELMSVAAEIVEIAPENDDLPTRLEQSSEVTEEAVPSTWTAALHRFFVADVGPPLVVLSIAGFVYTRLHLATQFTIAEALLIASSMILWWVQEYLLHRILLHSPFDWAGKAIHRSHHEKTYFHVSIDPPELLLGWLLAAHLILKATLPWHLCLSATIGYALAGLGYEFSHYIVHTKVKPPSSAAMQSSSEQSNHIPSRIKATAAAAFARWYARTRDNHMRHHLVDDGYWYAFGVPAMDDVFGTNPDVGEVRRRSKQKKGGAGMLQQ